MKLRFTARQHEASDIWSYFFEPLLPFDWVAGQSLRLEIPAGYDTDEKRFTIASAPYEKRVMITTRHSGSVFKKGLEALAVGVVVDAFAVEGDFVWGDDAEEALAVAIGVGITPFRSMLLQREFEQKTIPARLLSYARQGEQLYEKEWARLAIMHPEFSFSPTTVRLKASDIAESGKSACIYLSGPEKVVDQLKKELIQDHAVDPERILTDRFSGRI